MLFSSNYFNFNTNPLFIRTPPFLKYLVICVLWSICTAENDITQLCTNY